MGSRLKTAKSLKTAVEALDAPPTDRACADGVDLPPLKMRGLCRLRKSTV